MKMFDLEKYIKVGAYLKHDNDGKITVHIDANIKASLIDIESARTANT